MRDAPSIPSSRGGRKARRIAATLIVASAVTVLAGIAHAQSMPDPRRMHEASGPPAIGAFTPDETNTIGVFRHAAPSVVFIVNRQRIRQPFAPNEVEAPVGTGTGFIISPDGLIFTNAHVVAGSSSLVVILADRSERQAQIVGVAPEKDVALLIVPTTTPLPTLSLGDSDALVVGQKVLAIGNPFGLDHSLTVGVVSALNRETEAPTGRSIRGVIQTDAAINPGNSGGPLLNSRGEVVGMNSSIVSGSGGNIGIGFAVPANTLRTLLPQLRQYGRAARPILGIAVADDKFGETLGIEGVVVLEVQPGSVAEAAGITGVLRGPDGSVLLGDVIVGLDDLPVENSDDLLYALERHSPGDVVTLRTRHRGEDHSYRITLSAPTR